MNLLFANYGDFTTNSLHHVGTFAGQFVAGGHDCIVAVPFGGETVRSLHDARFTPATFTQVLDGTVTFKDGRPADVVHAWTPRENVRQFVLDYQRHHHSRLVVHLEDNELHLFASHAGIPDDAVANLTGSEIARHQSEVLSHPQRSRELLRIADGATVIVDTLGLHVPEPTPRMTLHPGVDFTLFRPAPPSAALRARVHAPEGTRLIVYPGSTTFANEAEIRELYAAIALLNERGTPTALLRTGFDTDTFTKSLPETQTRHVIHLGYLPRTELPGLLALADVLVQPGHPGPFNDYRLPSKVPEFLAMGKPVVLPASNIAHALRHGVEAWIVPDGRPATLATACEHLFTHPTLAQTLSENAVVFARAHFDLLTQTAKLLRFYEQVIASSPRPGSTSGINPFESEISLSLRNLAGTLDSSPATSDAARHAADLVPLVEHLERPDAARLERERAELERDVWRTHFENSRSHLEHVERQLRATETHAKNLADSSAARTRALSQRIEDLEAERDQARAMTKQQENEIAGLMETVAVKSNLVLQREQKIRAMQSTFSWQMTAPLRWLRRLFVDPFTRKPPTPPSAGEKALPSAPPRPAEPSPDLPHQVDEPHNWFLPPRRVLVRGWCFHPDGRKLTGMRARLGGRTIVGSYGFKRMDVAAAWRGRPQAEYCGWRVEVEVREEDAAIELQVSDESSTWISFFQSVIRVGEDLAPADLTNYENWLKVYDSPSADTLHGQRTRAQAFASRPLISILLPVYNTPERWLHRAIESVREQSYPFWELCIADDASTAPHVARILDEARASDGRIKVVRRATNGHISAASNSALDLASGEFIGLLDHDDELAPNALYEVAVAINAHPRAKFLFSDEDKIDEDGRRYDPYFKPAWDPELFLGQNYVCHFAVYRASALREAGSFRVGYEGSQDWDLALRVTGRAAAGEIVHIPRILYHWRAIAGSTAREGSEKDYPVQAARRALEDHIARHQIAATLEPVPGDHWRVVHEVPTPAPLVSIIIPTRNNLGFIRRCVESIRAKTDYPDWELIIVDNQSDDADTLAWFGAIADERITIVPYPQAFNYSAINNHAVRHARGELVALLNNDLEVINPGWLTEMVRLAVRPEIGCVGAMLYYPNDMIQHAGVILGVGGVGGHAYRDFPRGSSGMFNRARLVQTYSAVTAACLVVRKAVFLQACGLDETELAVAFNDVDFCLKVREAGYRNLWTPFAELYHHESASRGADDTPDKASRFQNEVEAMLRRWGPVLTSDPTYNPNLTFERNDFSLAVPPRPAQARCDN